MEKPIGITVKTRTELLQGSNTTLGRTPTSHRVVINLHINTRDTKEYPTQDQVVYSGSDPDVAERIVEDLNEPSPAIKAWCNWYSAKLSRIEAQMSRGERHEDYSPAE